MLWLPVWMAAGALLYYSLPFEPPAYHAGLLVALGGAAWFSHRRGVKSSRWLVAAWVLCFGFFWAQLHVMTADLRLLASPLPLKDVSGRLLQLENVPGGYRLTLDRLSIEGLEAAKTPQRIRIKLRAHQPELLTGQHIRLRAGLMPPSGPVMPGGFDFARYFYFQHIGAVGFALPPVTIVKQDRADNVSILLQQKRMALSSRIQAQMPMPEAAIASTLMTGDRAAIPDAVNEVMRTTNLSHILAISGMHMALITGLVFFVARWLLVALPWGRPVTQGKKIAALLALLCGGGYLVMAGFPVSACRAYVMVALIFGAVLLDREVMPMRSLALAALLLLMLNPSYAIQPGFQLSFVATAALIAWYQFLHRRIGDALSPEHRTRRIGYYFFGIIMTSLVAELATAPLVWYHFNSLSLVGLMANFVVMPIVSFWIMPCVLLAYAFMPLGLEWLGLELMRLGIATMLQLAEWIAALPQAHHFLVAPTGWGAALSMAGFFWLVLCVSRYRLVGAGVMMLGLCSVMLVRPPDLLVSADFKQVAVRINEEMMLVKGRPNGFVTDQWANGLGKNRLQALKGEHDSWQCDALGCIYRNQGKHVAFPGSFEGQAEDCLRADWVVSPFYLGQKECRASRIDRRAREQYGAHWLWIGQEGIEIGNAGRWQGRRPWSQ